MSERTEHTPGPWKVDPHTGVVYASDNTPVATGGYLCAPEHRANARLIGEGPELLELARALATLPDDYTDADLAGLVVDACELVARVENGGAPVVETEERSEG